MTRASLLSALLGVAILPCASAAPLAHAGDEPGAQQTPARDTPLETQWFSGGIDAALRAGTEGKQDVLIYFWMEGSQHCQRMYGETLQDPVGQAALAPFVCISADVASADGAALVQRFGIQTLPTILIVDPSDRPEDAILGFAPPAFFAAELERVRSDVDTVSARRAAAEGAPDDLDLRLALAQKLGFVGQSTESDAILESIKADDPRGETVVGAQLALYDVRDSITSQASDPSDPLTYDLEAMRKHLRRVRPPAVRFEGWQWVAGIEFGRGDQAAFRTAVRRAWPDVGAGMSDFADEMLWRYWDMRDDLARADRLLMMKMGQALVESSRQIELPEPEQEVAWDEGGEEEEEQPREMVARHEAGLALALFLNGKKREALETLERALELRPGFPTYQQLRDTFQGKRTAQAD